MANPPAKVSNPAADDAAARANDALWYAFKGIGRAYLVRRGSPAAGNADGASVHGYSTIASALSNPNELNAISQVTVSQWDEWSSLPVGGGTMGVIETVNVTWANGVATSSTPQNPSAAAASSVPGLGAIGDFFSRLTESSTWIRAAKILVGGAILLIGIAHVTGMEGKIGDLARKVPA